MATRSAADTAPEMPPRRSRVAHAWLTDQIYALLDADASAFDMTADQFLAHLVNLHYCVGDTLPARRAR